MRSVLKPVWLRFVLVLFGVQPILCSLYRILRLYFQNYFLPMLTRGAKYALYTMLGCMLLLVGKLKSWKADYCESSLVDKIYMSSTVFFFACLFFEWHSSEALNIAIGITFFGYAVAYGLWLFSMIRKTIGKTFLGISVAFVLHQFLVPFSVANASSAFDNLIGLESTDFPITISLLSNFYYIFTVIALLASISIFTSWISFFWIVICLLRKKTDVPLNHFMHGIGGAGFTVGLIIFLGLWNGVEHKFAREVRYLASKVDFSNTSSYPIELKGDKQVLHKNSMYTYYEFTGSPDFMTFFSGGWNIEFRTEKIQD